mgnify:CR=1 FL=1
MSEPKILPPSLRPNKRYIAFEIISEQPVKYNEFTAAVFNSMFSLLGELGSSEAKIWFISNLYDDTSQKGVLKCTHDAVEKIRAVLSLVQIVGETKAVVRIMGVTGTIKSAKAKYLTQKDLRSFAKR